jgi:hypothetical protein
MYNYSPLIPAGICHVQLTNPTNGKIYNVKFVAVDDKDANINLVGSRAAQQVNLIQVNHENVSDQANEVHAVNNQNQCTRERTKEDILQKYPDVFEGIGELAEPLHLEVDDTVKPVQIPPRRIPAALRKPLKDHLDELEEQDIIQKVVEPTEWVSSVVVNKKSNWKIRLCLYPQPSNKALKRCHYPIPTIEEVLPDLTNAKLFPKVDCRRGYWQIKLDNDSSMLTTFNTPFGQYRWTRIPFTLGKQDSKLGHENGQKITFCR